MKQWYNVQIVGPIREAAKIFGSQRSPLWRKARAQHLKEHPECAVCGRKDIQMNVHHIKPFSVNPLLELEPSNLITLCREHHWFIGHLLSWKSYNIDVIKDSNLFLEKIKSRP